MWCFCGHNVVKCVANVDTEQPLFGDEKYDTNLNYFFRVSSGG
jgi:hypothetical protein